MDLKNSAADPEFVSTTWTSPVPWNLLGTKNSMGVHWGCDLIWFNQCLSVTLDGICSSDLLMYENNPETRCFLKQPCSLVYLLSTWFMLSEGVDSAQAASYLLTEHNLDRLVLYILCLWLEISHHTWFGFVTETILLGRTSEYALTGLTWSSPGSMSEAFLGI